MSSEEQMQKYSYKFRLEAPQPGKAEEDANKAELQAYINDVLGISKTKKSGSKLTA
jgi:hypothetical protein